MQRLRNLLAGLALLTAYADAHGQAVQALQPIRDITLATLQLDAATQVMLAPGLRLPACRQPLVASASSPSVADVRCPDAPGWRLFVPVRAAAATAPAAAGAVASAEAAVIIKRGDPVLLRASIGGTEVTMQGRALGQARAGGIVNVENASSHRILRGRLTESGVVDVLN